MNVNVSIRKVVDFFPNICSLYFIIFLFKNKNMFETKREVCCDTFLETGQIYEFLIYEKIVKIPCSFYIILFLYYRFFCLWMPSWIRVNRRWKALQGKEHFLQWKVCHILNFSQYFFNSWKCLILSLLLYTGYWRMWQNEWSLFKRGLWKYDGCIPMRVRWRL